MNIPKRHHYLPQFYLKNFTDDNGLLWVFDREKNEYRQQLPKDTAIKGYYYAFKGKDGRKHTEIENFFSVIEGKTKPILIKLDKKESINTEEKEILAIFISFLKTRVPHFEKLTNESSEKIMKQMNRLMFSSEERVAAMIDRYEKETGKKIKIDPKELIDFIQGDRYDIKFPREHSIESMLLLGQDLIGYFLQMDWFFLWAPKNSSFITSDNPFLLLPPSDYNPKSFYGVGILTPGAKKIIPLTSHTCLIMGDHGGRMIGRIADPKAIRAINLYSAINSDRFLIARAKLLLERIVQITKVNKLEKKERIKIS
jgi:hypothetical protein